MTIQLGERLPDVPLTVAGAEGPQPTTTGEFFAGKRIPRDLVAKRIDIVGKEEARLRFMDEVVSRARRPADSPF